MDIQWYPGHMTKARRQILADLKLVDIVIELIDARVPQSSRNPDIPEIHRKPYVIAATKIDLADAVRTKVWMDFWREKQEKVVLVNILAGQGIGALNREIHNSLPNLPRIPRALIVGIPNVGKSSLINRLSGKSGAKTGAKPGVTRGKQWIKSSHFQFLDTPGILWPKFDSQEVARKLATIAAIKDDIVDWEENAVWLLNFLRINYCGCIKARYNLSEDHEDTLAEIGRRRGCLQAGGIVDKRQAAHILLQDFRSGRLGPITLELPERKGEPHAE